MLNAQCLYCTKKFHVKPSQIKIGGGKFCSRVCKQLSERKRINKICLVCKKDFWIHPYRTERDENEGKFCSLKCRSTREYNSNYKGKNSWIKKDPIPPPKGENHWAWKGGRIFRKGYYYIVSHDHPFRNSDNHVAEHRLVMEKKIGRYLKKNEIVHHINHKRDDNRIENLMILSQGEHTTLHHKGGTWSGDREKQSLRIKEIRKNKFWSTKT